MRFDAPPRSDRRRLGDCDAAVGELAAALPSAPSELRAERADEAAPLAYLSGRAEAEAGRASPQVGTDGHAKRPQAGTAALSLDTVAYARKADLRHMPSRFEELPDHRLDDLTDEQLLAYLVAARETGEARASTVALQHLVFRHLARVRARIACKVPAELVDDLAHDAMVEAIQAAFDGTAIPQFYKWLNVIVSRTVADFWRGPAGRRLRADRAAEIARGADAGDDDVAPAQELHAEDQEGLVELEDLIAGRLASLSEVHRAVVELLVFEGHPANAVSKQTGVTASNAYKIAQRFRDDLRAHLDGRADAIDEPGPGGPGGTGLPA